MIRDYTQWLSKISSILGEWQQEIYVDHEEIVLLHNPAHIAEGIRRLRDHKMLALRQLIDLTAVDYPSREARFELVYALLSMQHNFRMRIKIRINDGQEVPSVQHVFTGANWYEREIWDMFGISFRNHPDLRRILTDYGFEGFPLRKDFPLTGYKEVHYSEAQEKVIYEDVSLPLAFREFDFLSPWQGPLPGDEKAKGEM